MSAQPARPLFVAAGEGRKSAWATIKADGTATGGAFALVETVIPRGDSSPLHVHRDEDEAFYVLDGTVDLVCGKERFRPRPVPWPICHGAFHTPFSASVSSPLAC